MSEALLFVARVVFSDCLDLIEAVIEVLTRRVIDES